MARIRSIHPGLTSDEAYMSMSIPAKAGWTSLWMHCDDHGIFEWKPIVLKALIFPADNIDFAGLLDEWLALDCVRKVDIEGKPCGIVRNFAKYQRPKNPSYRYFKDNNLPKDIGSYTAVKGAATPALPQLSGTTPEESPQMEDEGGSSRREDESGKDLKTRAFFDEFWNVYPRRDSDEQRERAEADFAKLAAKGVDPAVITFCAKAYCAKVRKQNNYATRYVKVAWRWLAEQDFAGASAALSPDPEQFEPAERDWHSAVKRWLLNESNWPRWAGNAPGTPSCRCPPEVLASEGVCPNTARRIDDSWYFAADGTSEMQANLDFAARHKLKIRLYDIVVDGIERHGAWFMKRFPPGYDEATGEYRPADKEDAA